MSRPYVGRRGRRTARQRWARCSARRRGPRCCARSCPAPRTRAPSWPATSGSRPRPPASTSGCSSTPASWSAGRRAATATSPWPAPRSPTCSSASSPRCRRRRLRRRRWCPSRLAFARSCYDHLAGELGVRVHDRMVERGHLACASARRRAGGRHRGRPSDGSTISASPSTASPPAARPRSCLDWTQRRSHLGGAVGAGLLDHYARRALAGPPPAPVPGRWRRPRPGGTPSPSTSTWRSDDRHRPLPRPARQGLFVMPNPWDRGSARILAELGFVALATTSSGLGRVARARTTSRSPATSWLTMSPSSPSRSTCR